MIFKARNPSRRNERPQGRRRNPRSPGQPAKRPDSDRTRPRAQSAGATGNRSTSGQSASSGNRTTASRSATPQILRLVLDKVELKPQRWRPFGNNVGWDMYFVFAVEHPTTGETMISAFPDGRPIDFSKADRNSHRFGPRGRGADGATILEIPMPADRHIKIEAFAMQAKSKTRRTAETVSEISGFVGKNVLEPAATTNPYVAAAAVVNRGVGMVGNLVSKTKDKNRGFKSLGEKFGSEFNNKRPVKRIADFNRKEVKLHYRWTTSSR